MQAQLVGAEQLGDRRVVAERALQGGDVPLVVDPLLEVADVAGGQADQLHPPADALVGDDVMLGQGGRLLGLVDAQLDLVVAAGRSLTALMWSASRRAWLIARPYLTAARRQACSSSSTVVPVASLIDLP